MILNDTENSKGTVRVNRTYTMVLTSIFAVLLALCSWISIPSVVPFTLQTFGIFLSLLILGGASGTMAILIYLLLGAVGLPVFAGFSGGFATFLGPTGGYLVGFIFTGIVYWIGTSIFKSENKSIDAIIKICFLILGLIACYAFGTLWFINVFTKQISFFGALKICVIPFLIPDLIKLAVAFAGAKLIGKALKRVR